MNLATRTNSFAVLHVDDEPGFAEMAAEFLEREDGRLAVSTAASVEDALDRYEIEEFDCVISDHDMPGQTGIEFLELVREDHPSLPFVLFTGKGSEEVASEAISAGVTDYLQKESGTDQYAVLANKIGNAVERSYAERTRDRHLEAIETASEGIGILDEDGEFVYVNGAYADLYGYEPEEMVGEHWELLYPDDEVPFAREEILPTVAREGQWHGRTTGLRADGSTFPEDHVVAETETGDLICTVQDASDRREREREIEALHSTARSLARADTVEEAADVAVDAVCNVLDMPVNTVFLHDEAERRLVPVAWTERAEELVGEMPTFEPDDALAWRAFEADETRVYDDVSSVSGRFNPETNVGAEIIVPMGEYGVVTIGAAETDAFDEADVSLAEIVAMHAETALNRIEGDGRAEESAVGGGTDTDTDTGAGADTNADIPRGGSVREREQRRNLVETLSTALPDYVFVYDEDGTYVDVLTGWEQGMEMYAPDDLVGNRVDEMFGPEVADRVQALIDEVLESGDPETTEYPVRADEAERWYEASAAPIPGGYEGAPAVLVVARHVSERKRREQELRRQTERIEALHEVATTIGTCDTPDAVYDRVVRAAEEILEFDIAIVDSVTDDGGLLVPRAVSSELNADEYYEETAVDADDNLAAEAFRTGDPSLVADLHARGVDPASTEFRSALTVPIGEYGIFQTVDRNPGAFDERDLEMVELLLAHAETQLTRLENRRRLRERTRELELQNERLEEFARVVSHDLRNPLNVAQGNVELANEEYDSERLDAAADAVDRSLALVDDLLTLAREGERAGDVEPVDLGAVAEECWRNVDTGEGALVCEADRTVRADPGPLKQLLENLFRNCVDHGGEDVTVAVGETSRGFYVADDGPGIPETERERVFDVGYSTADAGTGFGLNIVREIADAHGWDVTVAESDAGGARFDVTGCREP